MRPISTIQRRWPSGLRKVRRRFWARTILISANTQNSWKNWKADMRSRCRSRVSARLLYTETMLSNKGVCGTLHRWTCTPNPSCDETNRPLVAAQPPQYQSSNRGIISLATRLARYSSGAGNIDWVSLGQKSVSFPGQEQAMQSSEMPGPEFHDFS
jgi:hypothetical protein